MLVQDSAHAAQFLLKRCELCIINPYDMPWLWINIPIPISSEFLDGGDPFLFQPRCQRILRSDWADLPVNNPFLKSCRRTDGEHDESAQSVPRIRWQRG